MRDDFSALIQITSERKNGLITDLPGGTSGGPTRPMPKLRSETPYDGSGSPHARVGNRRASPEVWHNFAVTTDRESRTKAKAERCEATARR